jgi:S-ribosylhomocysteine lyase LuxS involved in autoinducer biosynthesis
MSEKKKLTKKQEQALKKIKTVGSIDLLQMDAKTYSTALKLSGELELAHVINMLHAELERMIDFYEANIPDNPKLSCGDYVTAIKAQSQKPS